MAVAAQPTREEERELRDNIRGLLHRAQHDRHNLISLENNSIVNYIEESNQYANKITRPRDQALETELFSYVTAAGVEVVNRLRQGGRAFTAGDLIRILRTRWVHTAEAQQAGAEDPEAFNWAGLGQSVSALFRTPPVVHHMLGPMDAQPRQRRQVQRQAKRRAPVGEAVRPEELDALDDQEKQETDRNMEQMWGVLRDNGDRAVLLDLVLNHASFAQTVENLFTLSFLVRDGKAALERDDEQGTMVIRRANTKQSAKDKGADEAGKMQFVIALDIETWEQWKRSSDPSKPPMMPHRKEWRQQQQHEDEAEEQQQQEEDEAEQEQEAEAVLQQEQVPDNQQRQQQAQQQQRGAKRTRRQQSEEQQQQQQPDGEGWRQQAAQQQAAQQQAAQQQAAQQQAAQQQAVQQQAVQQQAAQQVKQEPAAIPADSGVIVIPDSTIVISDSEIVIPDSEGDEVVSPPPPRRQQQQPATTATQVKQEQRTPHTQGTQLTQGTQHRGPKRGKRA